MIYANAKYDITKYYNTFVIVNIVTLTNYLRWQLVYKCNIIIK